MPIVRRKLDANTVYPTNLRYDEDTDTVQSLVNGDWVDSPEADPRHQTTLPPRITSNPACDAAQSVVDALHGQIDQVIEAIDNSSTLFTIAGIILSIFTLGAFALFVSLALGIGDQMLGFGTAALEAALTEPVYHTLACILSCNMDGNGRLDADGLAACISDVNDQIGGIAAIVINSMLALAGEGGINNIASLGTATGDCDDCDCGWCHSFDFTISDDGFSSWAQCTTLSTRTSDGWQGQCNTCAYFDTSIEITFDTSELTHIYYTTYLDADSLSPDTGIEINNVLIFSQGAGAGVNEFHKPGSWDGTINLKVLANCQCTTFTRIISVTLMGRGENPFTDNCP